MITRPKSTIPDTPGSYQFKDSDGRIIYVGKAKSLRSRLASYFADPDTLPERTRQMVETAKSVEWIEVNNEVDALFLEFNLIKQHRPRFNVRLKDDKSYPWLAITLNEAWPRAVVMRGTKKKGVKYFGPFAHAYAIRETLDLLLRTFPIRTCTNAKFDRHHKLGRPCLYAHIEKCSAPCVDDIDKAQYDSLVDSLIAFLDGDTEPVLIQLQERMAAASNELEFELAARLRDQIVSVEKALERQQMVDAKQENYDIVGWSLDELEVCIQVFLVRHGRVAGRNGLVLDRVEALSEAELIGRVIEYLYADGAPEDIPAQVLVPEEPDDLDLYESFLSLVKKSKVQIRVPKRGAKRELLETVTHNANETLIRHKMARSTDHNARAKALTELQTALKLSEAPLRIECYDISNLGGTEIVGSMVVMEDGLPKRGDYRHFKMKHQTQQDDFASMEEMLMRRFQRYLSDREVGARAGKRFAYPPNLVLIDGGKGQLNAVARVLEDLGLESDIALASLAKKFEEVYLPGYEEAVRIPRDSEALYLLQTIRDEAHRFAITYHRKLRDKLMTKSVLDDIAGLGPARKARLLKQFGSLKRIRALSRQELTDIGWLPESVGVEVFARLHGESGVP